MQAPPSHSTAAWSAATYKVCTDAACVHTVNNNENRHLHAWHTGPIKQLFVKDVGSGTITGVTCRHVVNAAGLGATQLASSLQGVPQSSVPKQYLAKGSYFSLQGSTSADDERRDTHSTLQGACHSSGSCIRCQCRVGWASTARSTCRDVPSLGRTCSGWMQSTTMWMRGAPTRFMQQCAATGQTLQMV